MSLPIFLPVALSLLAAGALATALIVTQIGLRHMSVHAGATIGLTTSALLFWMLAPALLDFGGFTWAALGVFALVGAFYPAAATLMTYQSNRLLGPTLTGTVSSTAPLFAIGLAVVILDEALSFGIAAGGVLVVAALMLLSWRRPAGVTPGWRLMLPLASAAVRGLAQTLTKLGLSMWPSAFAATLIGYTVSAGGILAFRALSGSAPPLKLRDPGAKWFMAAGLLNGAALLLMNHALKVGRVGVVAPVIALYPLFTMVLSAAFLKTEIIGLRVVLASLIAVAGVAVLVSG